jgi:RNA polymerase sigma-70 factor (ECF subfamily)
MRARPQDESDGELWRRARQRDGDAFGVLFERHATAVYNHCFRRTASWSAAEELTSVVFLEAWRRKDVRLHGDSILPWLLAVANNATRNADRSRRRYKTFLAKLPPPAPEPDASDHVVQSVDEERQMAAILKHVSGLRVEEREVLALCDWGDLTYAEAATALNIPVGTVRSRLARARDHLRVLSADPGPPTDYPIDRVEPCPRPS